MVVQIEENPDAVDLAALNKILVVKAQHDDDATRFTAICWLNTFLAVAADQLLGCFADLIVAVLPGISHENEDIKHAAMACNSRLLQMDLSDKLRTTGLQDVLGAVSNELRSPQVRAPGMPLTLAAIVAHLLPPHGKPVGDILEIRPLLRTGGHMDPGEQSH